MAMDIRGNETILVVEDQPEVCEVVTAMLRGFGFHVFYALTPSEALAIASNLTVHIDLLMTDDYLPEMRGPQLADAIRSIRPGIRILFMTGSIDNERLENYPEADLIEKPFQPLDLHAKVREALDRRRAA
jgi:two-component system cell cycle sensor histidine kinase/response regulator CckA